ncbi:MAG TPA: hypothetical protein VGG16_14380 [Streptosporangiaceae bacterium]|jgi:hypothetical protein
MPAHDVLAVAREPRSRSTETARRLVVTWQHPDERLIEPIGLLEYDGQRYRFGYISHALNVKGFRPLLGFRDLYARYVSDKLFPLFAQRVMDPRRPDYQRYVRRLGLDEDATPWEQIARSQGRRQGDTIQLLPEPVNEHGVITGRFLVHGVRHVPGLSRMLDSRAVQVDSEQVEAALAALRPGDVLGIASEPGNEVNSLALMVVAQRVTPVGWIPNLLLEDMHRLMARTDVSVTAEHVNGPDAPWHLRVLARLTARGAGDFRFFTGEKWELLAAAGQ